MRRLLVLALLAVGCSGASAADAGRSDAPSREPRVELGTGASSFVAISDEDAELELVAGPQGGWHVDLSARIWNMDIDRLRIAYEAAPAGASATISIPTELELSTSRVAREDDHWVRAGDVLQLDVAEPGEVVGIELDVTVRVVDRAGRTAEHARRAMVVDRE